MEILSCTLIANHKKTNFIIEIIVCLERGSKVLSPTQKK